jgi:hypothetical protein
LEDLKTHCLDNNLEKDKDKTNSLSKESGLSGIENPLPIKETTDSGSITVCDSQNISLKDLETHCLVNKSVVGKGKAHSCQKIVI